MPKIVDVEAVRREITEALLRVLAKDGIEAVSVRSVAAAAGRSPGAVQKYFATKDAMLTAALEGYCERAGARIGAVPVGEPVDTVTGLVAATLPLDEPSRQDTLVLHEFAVCAARNETFAERLRAVDRAVLDDLGSLLDRYACSGALPADSVTDDAAAALLALGDGLAMRLLYSPDERDAVLLALRAGVAALLGA